MAEQAVMGGTGYNMKNVVISIILMLTWFILPPTSFAQGMMGETNMMSTTSSTVDTHAVAEETKGKEIFNQLQSKQATCQNLSDDDFEVLGEYFMGQMAGSSHEAMNTMMSQMMGNDGERQMHIAMGKRLSGCDTNAPMPQNMTNAGIMPMMMSMMGGRNSMMDIWGINSLGEVLSLVSSILVVIVLSLSAIWFWKQINKK